MKHKPSVITYSWGDIESFCQKLFLDIQKKGFHPDVIVTPLRGGAVPSVMLAHKLHVRSLVPVALERTVDDSPHAEFKPVEMVASASLTSLTGKNVLLVDDIVDTGASLAALLNLLRKFEPKDIYTVSLVINRDNLKDRSIVNFYGQEVSDWVKFPWES